MHFFFCVCLCDLANAFSFRYLINMHFTFQVRVVTFLEDEEIPTADDVYADVVSSTFVQVFVLPHFHENEGQ